MKPVLALSLLISLFLLLSLSSCATPPAGTVWLDTDNNGVADSLALDADKNGIPDADANGQVMLVSGTPSKKTVEAAERADEYGPTVLGTAGGIAMPLGGGLVGAILMGIAAAWRNAKFGRIFLNTVTTIQNARRKLMAEGAGAGLQLLDDALSQQLPETMKMVADVKAKYAIGSVTDSK